jgi:hypothetical protein
VVPPAEQHQVDHAVLARRGDEGILLAVGEIRPGVRQRPRLLPWAPLSSGVLAPQARQRWAGAPQPAAGSARWGPSSGRFGRKWLAGVAMSSDWCGRSWFSCASSNPVTSPNWTIPGHRRCLA